MKYLARARRILVGHLLLAGLPALGGAEAGAAPLPKSKGNRLVARAQLAPPPGPLLDPRPTTAGGLSAPADQRLSLLRSRIEDVLRGFVGGRGRVGLMVQEVHSGAVLLSREADRPFNPASNTKIFTTAAALQLLGPDWRYRTRLLTAAPAPLATASVGTALPTLDGAPGVHRGDLFLQGSGDPSLGSAGMVQLARGIARAGIHRIEGDLVVDGQFRALLPGDRARPPVAALPSTGLSTGSLGMNIWQPVAAALPPAAPLWQPGPAVGNGALMVHRNVYTVHVSPGRAGQPASFSVEPRSPSFVINGKVQTTKGKRARLQVSHHREGGRLIVQVRGRIGERHGEARVHQHFGEGGLFATAILRQALQDFGIEVTGQVRVGPPPPGPLQVVAEYASPALSEICWLSNKDSNNFVAETIFKTLGGERYGLPGTLDKGARAVSEWIGGMGMDPGRIRLVNGSGLTYENRLRPEDLNQLLRRLYYELALAPEFLQSLAVGGVDGTIRSRFHGSSVGLVRAKTGTLTSVSALSGYVGEKRDVLAFSILMEGFGPKRLEGARYAQVQIVESLLRYLRADAPAPPLLPRPPQDPGEAPAPASGEPAEGEGG